MAKQERMAYGARVSVALFCMTLSLLVLDDGLYVTLGTTFPVLRDIATLFGVAVVGALALIVRYRPSLFNRRMWTAIAGASLVLYLCGCGLGLQWGNPVLLLVGVLANSAVDAWLYVLTFMAFANVSDRLRLPMAAASFAAAYGVETAAGHMFAQAAPFVDCAILACLWAAVVPITRTMVDEVALSEPEADLAVVNPRSFLPVGHLCFITVLAFDFAYGMALSLAPATGSPWMYDVSFAALAIVFVLGIALGHRFNADMLFVAAAAIALAGMVVAPSALASLDERLGISHALLLAGSACFDLLIALVVASVGAKSGRSVAFVAAYATCLSWLGIELGTNVGDGCLLIVAGQPTVVYWVGVALVVTFATYCMVVLTRVSFVRAIEGLVPLAKVREQSAAEQGSVSASQPASGDMAHERAETQPMAEPSQAQRQHAFEPDAVQPSPVEDAFEARCNAVAQHYGLTKREREVFYLLACGRTLRVIKEKLVISPNTVRFHTKNIYTKLGVHSQQELIDRVEAGSSPR